MTADAEPIAAAQPWFVTFLPLKGRRVVLLGHGEAAEAKIRALLECEADCVWIDPQAGALAGKPIRRPWRLADFTNAVMVVAAPNGSRLDAARRAARAAGAQFYAIDDPARSDFATGARIVRGPIVVGVSTAGIAPVLGQTLRQKIESLLPPWLGDWARAALNARPKIAERFPAPSARRQFWRRAVEAALIDQQPDWDKWFAQDLAPAPTPNRRSVILLTAPPNADAWTIGEVRRLGQAEWVFAGLRALSIAEPFLRRDARRFDLQALNGDVGITAVTEIVILRDEADPTSDRLVEILLAQLAQ